MRLVSPCFPLSDTVISAAKPSRLRAAPRYRLAAQKTESQGVAELSQHRDISGLAGSHMKAASEPTQERLTVVEISGSDGSSWRHRDELEMTQSTRDGRRGLLERRGIDSDLIGTSFSVLMG